ncbi:MAG: Chemotaxis response regulator protein-glutamate methylesterase [bacterium]|nr:Chemotaxis response regulator protein-glutamate methylesterase [bacterium]
MARNSEVTLVIVDDSQEMRETLKTLLTFNETVRVVGEASNGEEAVDRVAELKPDLVLMDINMPGMDGLKATEAIAIKSPRTGVIIISVQEEMEYMRRAMSAGAREYLVKPFDSDELFRTINNVVEKERFRWGNVGTGTGGNGEPERGKIVTVFSPRGGIGKSLLATNVASELKRETRQKVLCVDLSVEFGDVALLLNCHVASTLTNLAQTGVQAIDLEYLKSNIHTSPNGVDVLAAPTKPEYAEMVTSGVISKVLELAREEWDWIVVDTRPTFAGEILAALDLSDEILMLIGGDFLSLKSASLSLQVFLSLNYNMDAVKVILNRANCLPNTKVLDLEKGLKKRIDFELPLDQDLVLNSINRGVPFMDTNPTSDLAKAVRSVVQGLLPQEAVAGQAEKKSGGLLNMFARR